MSEATLDLVAQWQDVRAYIDRRYAELREELKPTFETRDKLKREIQKQGYKLPSPRHQSDVQQQVARCPRCTGRIE